MKKLLFLIAAVSTLLIGCAPQEDQTSPPLDTNAPAGGTTTTNQ
jgi:nitrous oxide reductase accessory protein NosL